MNRSEQLLEMIAGLLVTNEDRAVCEALTVMLTEEDWRKKVKPKYHPPEGTFKKSAEEIASVIMQGAKDYAQAILRLNYFLNRGGRNIKQDVRDNVKKAMEIIRIKMKPVTAQ